MKCSEIGAARLSISCTVTEDEHSVVWVPFTESELVKIARPKSFIARLDLTPFSGTDGVAGLVGIEGGVVSGVINLESSGVEAPDWRPRHDEHYHEA